MIESVESPGVLIFRTHFLAFSETFILQQAEHLDRYRRHYVGLRRVRGLKVAPGEATVLNEGGIRGALAELNYLYRGPSQGLLRAVRQFRPSLVHAHFGTSGVAALELCERLDLPLVVTFHGFDATIDDRHLRRMGILYSRMLVKRRAELFKKATRVIAVSQFIADRLLDQGCPPHKLVVHYIGVDVDRFRSLESKDPADGRTVLFVGRMVEKKGCEYLIRAMARVQEKFKSARLVLIGGGPLEEQLRGLVQQLGVNAEFIGVQPAEVVASWMKRVRVLCAPSVTASNFDSEGLGMILLEAQASGTPVVSSLHGGMPEAVVDSETAILAPERDAAAIAAAIERMFSDEEWYQHARRAASAFVRDRFTIANQSRKLQQIYDEAIARAITSSTAIKSHLG